jgi:hypothetical protein
MAFITHGLESNGEMRVSIQFPCPRDDGDDDDDDDDDNRPSQKNARDMSDAFPPYPASRRRACL